MFILITYSSIEDFQIFNDVCGFSIDINVEMIESNKNIEIASEEDTNINKDEKDSFIYYFNFCFSIKR